MKKIWRSGMIDKKIVKEREQEEYINRLHSTILELSRKPPEPDPRYNHPDIGDLINGIKQPFKIADDYDEVRVGDNVILDFNKQFITTQPKTPVKDAIVDTYSYWAKRNAHMRCDADIEFGIKIEKVKKKKKTLNEIRKAKGFGEK